MSRTTEAVMEGVVTKLTALAAVSKLPGGAIAEIVVDSVAEEFVCPWGVGKAVWHCRGPGLARQALFRRFPVRRPARRVDCNPQRGGL